MPKMRMPFPAQPKIHTKQYSNFRGVDFVSDPSQVDDSRSPWAVNMISNFKGAPQKRLGWKKLFNAGAGVLGIYSLDGRVIVHTKDALKELKDGETIELVSELTGESSAGFETEGKLYILTGKEYLYVSEEKAGHVKDIAYTPICAHSKKVYTYSELVSDNFAYDLGTPFEDENILIPYRRESFDIDRSVMGNNAVCFAVVGKRIREKAHYTHLEVRTAEGNVIENVAYFFGNDLNINAGYEFYNNPISELQARTVYLKSYTPERDGLLDKMTELGDNSTSFTIRYPIEETEKNGYIQNCNILNFYNGRLFVSGNSQYQNADWYSEMGDVTYFKELNYTEICSENEKIMAYLPLGSAQGIVTNKGVFLRTYEWSDEIGYFFPVKSGIVTDGAICVNGADTLLDDPLFITKKGLMAFVPQNITGERVVQQRSSRVNPKLLKEKLEKAKITVFNGFFMICVDDKIYLADSRQKSYTNNQTGTFEYEWYYWDNCPASCFCEINGELYFGTEDGNVCKFCEEARFADWKDDNIDNAVPVVAIWSTKLDADGDFTVKKNMLKRGCGIFLNGEDRGNVKIYIRTDSAKEIEKAYKKRGIFDFAQFDFNNFSFEFAPRQVSAVNSKAKNYYAIQTILKSDEMDNDFCINGIVRRFVTKGFVK